jgi:hypothetical protein
VLLTLGSRLGPYEIQSAIGAGGMGEVLKARTIRILVMTSALKILPERFMHNPESVKLSGLCVKLAALDKGHDPAPATSCGRIRLDL